MDNLLDSFIEMGNLESSKLIDDRFLWKGSEYRGTISDLALDFYAEAEGIGKRLNTERQLEFRVSQFGGGAVPTIRDTITDLHDNVVYELIELMSRDTTNRVFKIREQMRRAQ